MEHNELPGSGICSGCHNGTAADGKPANHARTTDHCDVCHTTSGFVPATMDHNELIGAGACSSCHNGAIAAGKNNAHFITNSECDQCHRVGGWLPPTPYSHSGQDFPGGHSWVSCNGCHQGNNQSISYPDGSALLPCAACHRSDYQRELGEHGNAPVADNKDCTGACHEGAGEHSPNKRGW